ncbi:unnamed protein product [Ilex paraguariensis]|uniref:SBP-type domain-containing protein n=1 Tax=Ilex paraguariensis TaxID=185542 RepID=A0ABC8SR22_9AQUA
MELGWSSSSSSSNSSDSLHGLKFGQKIYYEDVGAGVPAKSGGGSSAGGGLPPPAPARKGRSGVVQGGQPPRCQVEGCSLDLSDAKTYYSRHKVCGMHSKSPKVIVAGLEQRFCQQCSRFHLLPEFDQGKRSCRRRLAGHNERRRKPPSGSLLSSHYSFAPSIFENNSRAGGGFVMDFTAYPKVTGRDPWQATRAADRISGNQLTSTEKFLPLAWQSNSQNPPPDLLLQGSSTRTGYPCNNIPLGGCFTGASDSSCALSLLSNQPWGSINRPTSLGANNFLNADGMPIVHSAVTNGAAINQFPSTSWGFRGNEVCSSSHGMPPDLGRGQISNTASTHYSDDLEMAQQSGRHYLEIEHSRAYDSSVQNMPWSL